MSRKPIEDFLIPGKRVHLIGIGGVSMYALGEVLRDKGIFISGSDIQDSDAVRKLRQKGTNVVIGHFSQNIEGADCIIRTAAARDDNVEVQAARLSGIPVFERAEVWGAIMKAYKNALCIAGTHGKTTTTSMSTQIAITANLDPTVMIGGMFPLIGAGHRVGQGDLIIMEACEYCDSFLNFSPTVATITNIEADHLDYFSGLEEIVASFNKYSALTPEDGTVVYNMDDQAAVTAITGINRRLMAFGIDNGDVHTENLEFDGALAGFDIIFEGKKITNVKLKVPGKYNVYNALAAAASMVALGADYEAIGLALSEFTGSGRRYEYKGELNGAVVYDDYAHHPSEITAVLSAAKAQSKSRVICVFQPHTYTRTNALLADFARELSAADIVILPDIYAARENNTVGISSKNLADLIPGAKYIQSFTEIADYLSEIVESDDIVLTVGAGDVYLIGDLITKKKGKLN